MQYMLISIFQFPLFASLSPNEHTTQYAGVEVIYYPQQILTSFSLCVSSKYNTGNVQNVVSLKYIYFFKLRFVIAILIPGSLNET